MFGAKVRHLQGKAGRAWSVLDDEAIGRGWRLEMWSALVLEDVVKFSELLLGWLAVFGFSRPDVRIGRYV